MRRLVVVGAGALGGAVAELWVERGGDAIGITATTGRHEALRRAGVTPSTADPDAIIGAEDCVVLSVPGSARQTEAATALRGSPHHRAVLVSTTGYFGDRAGPVSTDTPPGVGERAQAAATAEARFRAASPSGVVIRMGGLYTRGRGPLQSLLRRGHPIPGPPDRTLALIHYDDAASAIVAALLHPRPDPLYLGVVAPLPSRAAFYRLAAERHGLAPPTFTAPTEQPARVYHTASLRRDLLADPAHPDWRDATEA